ncbi:hypothetical protein SEVIR_5G470200v4 [Setaria viridis]|uniref:Uncharacterized protein n=2 Tax=Setaria TaxID=4554 RepID=K3XMQ9_SETIT|nr:bile salt-activated lipase [Setaria italica]XP_034598214.1 bile salt-activated lipase-like [Setaria viridis]RCV29186.1 hypothetical protein SETIT_5G463900v2 [Setaria italica]TKW19018.1 hypothetical protein SEVIR_5G470200v2 [Setaria viridis]
MEKRRRGDFGVLCLLLCAGVVACPADAKWHANPGRHDGKASSPGLPPLPAPPPTAGADLPPTQPAPHFGFPLQPTLGSAAPPTAGAGGEGYPFIGSNPTVPLPTGMTDTATVLPLPDTGDATATNTKVVGLAATVHVQLSMIGLGVVSAIVFLSTTCQLV